MDARPRFGERYRDRNRWTVREAGRELHARKCLSDAIVAGLTGQRPGLPERRNTQHRQSWVLLTEHIRTEASCLELSWPEVFHDRVGRREELPEPGLNRARSEIGLDGVLPAVLRLKVEGVLPFDRRPELSKRRAAARLDLDHRGAEVGEKAAGHLAREGPAELDDHDARERAAPIDARKSPRMRARAGRHRAVITRGRIPARRFRRATSPSRCPSGAARGIPRSASRRA